MLFWGALTDLSAEDIVIEKFVTAEPFLCQNGMIEGQDKEWTRLLTTDRTMTADLIVEAGDPLFIKRPEQNQITTTWAEAETV